MKVQSLASAREDVRQKMDEIADLQKLPRKDVRLEWWDHIRVLKMGPCGEVIFPGNLNKVLDRIIKEEGENIPF